MIEVGLPSHRDLFYDGQWQRPQGGYVETVNPATGLSLGPCAEASAADVDAAVQAAHRAQRGWAGMKPVERAAVMRRFAGILRANADELAYLDALNCGNPVREMRNDAVVAATMIEYCAGLATEVKGETLPMGDGVLNYSVREPYGVVARIMAYNHPVMFTAGKIGAALAVGNTVIMKPPHQAPLSSYRMMELAEGIFPAGVLSIITAGRDGSEALVRHPLVPRLSLIGSVPTGIAIAKAAAEQLKHVTLELGGKNACIVYPDADLDKAARAAVDGMNFTWCGQSCGSTSRLFLHESVYDTVMDKVLERVRHYKPGIPTRMDTTMGALISRQHLEKVLSYIEIAKEEGATLAYGGQRPDDPELANGFFVAPTVFTDVTADMRIAREEVFGPVLSVISWSDEEAMLDQVNAVDYGLTGGIWTTNLATAHRAAARIQAGFLWVNGASSHFLGASFGGYKKSGIGREEGFEELLSFTQLKNVNINL
ncbi:aldehyde dehydrogenase family protein [Rhodoferax sp.]|uniref:aldehyde dehydrogenase family protein n=1 Tax=Rhodoferax sp. TaxID=50421 RepID=UPI002720AA7E|nr:aldehyde dehydrogenase family protein [Rhodoferax sp.]MDO9195405.1 aldehyde dehydrogenase family protein [Rhodoferax sp.]